MWVGSGGGGWLDTVVSLWGWEARDKRSLGSCSTQVGVVVQAVSNGRRLATAMLEDVHVYTAAVGCWPTHTPVSRIAVVQKTSTGLQHSDFVAFFDGRASPISETTFPDTDAQLETVLPPSETAVKGVQHMGSATTLPHTLYSAARLPPSQCDGTQHCAWLWQTCKSMAWHHQGADRQKCASSGRW